MKSSANVRRVIVRAPNWIGDAVMATPFFASLRKTLPDVEVTCLCRAMVADIFCFNHQVNRIIELDETHGRSGWTAVRTNAALLKQERFDLAVSLPNSLSSALIFFLARIPRRVGYRRDWRRLFLTHSLPFPKKGQRPHRAESYLRLLPLVSEAPTFERQLMLPVSEEVSASVTASLANHGLGLSAVYAVIAPGAAQPNKMWMPERFAQMAHRLVEDGLKVVLVGAPAEKELGDRVAQLAKADGLANLIGGGSLLFTAEVIRRATVFVGNDSGLAHVAAAVDTPAVILSGPGDPTEVAPYSDKALTIAKEVFCKPCYKNHCWRKDKPLECLELIGVEEVFGAVISRVSE